MNDKMNFRLYATNCSMTNNQIKMRECHLVPSKCKHGYMINLKHEGMVSFLYLLTLVIANNQTDPVNSVSVLL